MGALDGEEVGSSLLVSDGEVLGVPVCGANDGISVTSEGIPDGASV